MHAVSLYDGMDKCFLRKKVILTFNSFVLASRIKAAYLICSVQLYILPLFQMSRICLYQDCLSQFRYPFMLCRIRHDGNFCKISEHCINCKDDHSTYSRSCPHWIRENESLAIKVTPKISYPGIRKFVQFRTPSDGVFYSILYNQQLKSVTHISTD